MDSGSASENQSQEDYSVSREISVRRRYRRGFHMQPIQGPLVVYLYAALLTRYITSR